MFSSYLATSAHGFFLPVIMASALIDSINPCAISVLFLTITFLFSLGKNRKFVLISGGVYILAIAIVYTLIGLGALQALSFFNVPNIMAKVGASILLIYSIIGLINEFYPSFPIKLKMPESTHTTLAKVINMGSIPAFFLLGGLVAMFEFPCTGGPYLFVLTLLHDYMNFWKGFWYLIMYNFVFVLPLILILLFATNKVMTEKIDRLRRLETKKARVILLLVLIAFGIMMFLL
ncbi:MAG: cytochrome c biogenesis protein CcdA [Candidatus Paceibacterota bacterium]